MLARRSLATRATRTTALSIPRWALKKKRFLLPFASLKKEKRKTLFSLIILVKSFMEREGDLTRPTLEVRCLILFSMSCHVMSCHVMFCFLQMTTISAKSKKWISSSFWSSIHHTWKIPFSSNELHSYIQLPSTHVFMQWTHSKKKNN